MTGIAQKLLVTFALCLAMAAAFETAIEIDSEKFNMNHGFTLLRGDKPGHIGVSMRIGSYMPVYSNAIAMCVEADEAFEPLQEAAAFAYQVECGVGKGFGCADDVPLNSRLVVGSVSTVDELKWNSIVFELDEYKLSDSIYPRVLPDTQEFYDFSNIAGGTGVPHFNKDQNFKCYLNNMANPAGDIKKDLILNKWQAFNVVTKGPEVSDDKNFLKN